MKINDYDEVFSIWSQTEGMGLRSLDDSKQGIEKFLIRNPNTNFVAIENNAIIGVILCGNDGRRANIYHTAVLAEYRKKGVGKMLVKAVIDALIVLEIHKVSLAVFEKNETGNIFWEKLGFVCRDDLIYRNFTINSLNS